MNLPPLKSMVLSATQIETFDPTTDWGCKRKWWFERIAGFKGTQHSSAALGESVHGTLERFLKHEVDQGGLHDLVIQAPGALEYLLKLRPRIQTVEKKIDFGEFKIAGVPVVGRVDWIANITTEMRPELGDWKTTSQVGKYAKTAGQIKHSIQMNVYAHWLFQFEMESMRMTHGVFQTRGAKKFLPTSCEITKRENDSRILEISNTIESMKTVREAKTPEEVEPNEDHCNIGFGCPHRAYCPRSGAFNMASLLAAFQPKVEAPPLAGAIVTPNQVLPPDAPASNPVAAGKLTIDDSKNPTGNAVAPPPAPADPPVVAPEAVVAPDAAPTPPPSGETTDSTKPRRGRKPGSKNKPTEFTAPPATAAEIAQMQAPCFVPTLPTIGPVKINKITIRHGARIGMPNFSSATVEVEMTGDVTGSAEEARESLGLQVKHAMTKELEVYTKPKETK